jgi:hypothetical protein
MISLERYRVPEKSVTLRDMNDIFRVGKVIEKMADPVIGLLQKVAGPAAEEVGLTFQRCRARVSRPPSVPASREVRRVL